ncbi:nuclear transport factor 2 family protein [Massilia sp. TSP1-1-2]|uniref:nuclear transport factor 2 family protein n=1 Tax=Massilia sp. TSP1-1-2 TaxID=2804649 RepID=UPI003CF70A95
MKKHASAAVLSLLVLPCAAFAQQSNAWEVDVRQFDTQYWKAFNECEIEKLTAMNTDDLEFYHDVGGISKGKAIFSESVGKNICGRPGVRVRREAVPESMRFFPMRDGARLYGAVVSGEHRFYEIPKGGKEVLTGQARFTHMLLLEGGQWKVSRVLSFDHGPARQESPRQESLRAEASISAAQLDQLAWHYVEKDGAFMDVRRDGKRLSVASGPSVFVLKAADKNEFLSAIAR